MNAATAKEKAIAADVENKKTEDFVYSRHAEEIKNYLLARIDSSASHGEFSRYFYLYNTACNPLGLNVTYKNTFHKRLVKEIRRFLKARGFKVSFWPWIFNDSDAMIWISWK